MFFRLLELMIALYYGALDEKPGSDSPPADSSIDRHTHCTYTYTAHFCVRTLVRIGLSNCFLCCI